MWFHALYQHGAAVFYSAQSFTVGTNGIYDVANTSNTFSSGDSFFALCEGSFNPASPLTNLLYVDDDNGASLMADINCPLSAGTTYILVTSPWASADTGDFTNTITGPGLITLPSVPAGTIEDLQTLVSGMGLAHGLTTALNSELQDALDALAVDDSATACGSLGAFLNQVRAQTGKKLRPDQALQLADAAGNIRTQLGC